MSAEYNRSHYLSQVNNIDHQLKEKAEDFIRNKPSSMASLVLIQDYLVEEDNPENMNTFLQLINGDIVESNLYKRLSHLNNTLQGSKIGAIAPPLSLKDTKGLEISLDTFKNKYFILSFGASWCDLCLEENEGMNEIRKKYKPSKLGMLSVSLDKEIDQWLQINPENNKNWLTAVDKQGWNSNLVPLYNIRSIPLNLLIDKGMTIISRDQSIDSLNILLKKHIK
ncbi:hypothetical protein AwDysgo_09510 [Bacteroidales bacterium]|nr:hypothetical protein AwDysgo_09510 [Bacteroidales bacterium]